MVDRAATSPSRVAEAQAVTPSVVSGLGVMLGCFHAHYNAPRFYGELDEKDSWARTVYGACPGCTQKLGGVLS